MPGITISWSHCTRTSATSASGTATSHTARDSRSALGCCRGRRRRGTHPLSGSIWASSTNPNASHISAGWPEMATMSRQNRRCDDPRPLRRRFLRTVILLVRLSEMISRFVAGIIVPLLRKLTRNLDSKPSSYLAYRRPQSSFRFEGRSRKDANIEARGRSESYQSERVHKHQSRPSPGTTPIILSNNLGNAEMLRPRGIPFHRGAASDPSAARVHT